MSSPRLLKHPHDPNLTVAAEEFFFPMCGLRSICLPFIREVSEETGAIRHMNIRNMKLTSCLRENRSWLWMVAASSSDKVI